ncbi:heavy metal translocating P-type ATPase metal-binding domain-containing protein [Hymenobacter sp. BT664]|uniref:Heavy metal translocating P-type ATPase metal-binding domain-containing protein n=1 Tax=Hymenobacter montanus TaxID=2771359 RepID=A0A927BDD0_9BACT|nr:heavy metal translocating P-type ATPase metal-binding domain-containing protein [Hymenobacter montanus]MBD2767923.1 heavy metal translocating P-type ATPase metal-binding domain-containing protein [Hymenobacter montanus]
MSAVLDPPATHQACAHCGDDCPPQPLLLADQPFCCAGCRTVYELLDANNLCTYYRLDDKPGLKVREVELPGRFDYLDAEAVQAQLLAFRSSERACLTLQVPQMHCTSCIWLLENLSRLNPGIVEARVQFLRKEITITYLTAETSLKGVVQLLTAVGYEPQITLAELGAQPHRAERTLYYQLGLAAFAFGNVMLLALPEYFSFVEELQVGFGRFFGYLSLALALPVLLFSARGFFRTAWQGLRQRYVNLDFPISLGLASLFAVSTFAVLTGSGPGYFDSFTGLVFFMLIGKWVQQHSYDALRFDRDFTSYFPVAVTRLGPAGEQSISVKELKVGHRIRVRHQEVVPADAVLLRGAGQIDYSFVSGESTPVARAAGELLYAGGRQLGEAIELEVVREVSQGYLTQLWNNPAFAKEEGHHTLESYANRVGRYFVALTLLLAAGTLVYWGHRDTAMMWRAFTSVLVIACPCALSLATPFALGAALRILGRHQLYLKNSAVIETLGRADTLVFDKTGTLTDTSQAAVEYQGRPLTASEQMLLSTVAAQSTHPLSQRLAREFAAEPVELTSCHEIAGQGISAVTADRRTIRLGAASFAGSSANSISHEPAPETPGPRNPHSPTPEAPETRVYLALDGEPAGYFTFRNVYRPGLASVLGALGRRYRLAVLSGDTDAEQQRLRGLFGEDAELRFRQSPSDKLAYIAAERARGRTVVMVGDGLNDAGALRAADAGIALTDQLTNFSPACDAILDAREFGRLATFLGFSRACLRAVLVTFGLSFCYNGLGLALAVQGRFTPIASAILMPISSLSVMVVATLLVRWAARRHQL